VEPLVFRDSLEGLDKVFRTDIKAPAIVLVTGPPGSMKTSFCYTLMSKYLEKTNEFGLYCTMEETVDSHVRNMESLGINLTKNMQISDLTDLREIDRMADAIEQTDYLAFLEKIIVHFKKKLYSPWTRSARSTP
jgi:KaiC/GvpD/RAD55 family RecA-like ATPase